MQRFDLNIQKTIFKHSPKGFYGVDKIGRPLFIDLSGRTDVNGMFKDLNDEQIFQGVAYEFEKLLKLRFMSCSFFS